METPTYIGKARPSSEIRGQLSLDTLGIDDQKRAFLWLIARDVAFNRLRGEKITEAGPYQSVRTSWPSRFNIEYKHKITAKQEMYGSEANEEPENFIITTDKAHAPDRKKRRLNIDPEGKCSLEIDTYVGDLVDGGYSAAGEYRESHIPHYHTEVFGEGSRELDEWIDQLVADMTT